MNWYFFLWRDVIEISIFSLAFYYFSRWLAYDKNNQLLRYFYLYCTVTLIAYQAQLTTLSTLLCFTAPIIIMLFIIMHQNILQRNFVALRSAKTSCQPNTWLESLIRSALIALNHSKELMCVIEDKDNLDHFIGTTLELNIPLHEGVLDLIIQSSLYNNNKFIWSTTRGYVTGINAEWKIPYQDVTLQEEIHTLPQWQQDALIITHNTDAVVMKSNMTTHTFTLIIQGTLYPDIDPHNALKLIQHYIRSKTVSAYQGAHYHGIQKSQKYSVEQSHP